MQVQVPALTQLFFMQLQFLRFSELILHKLFVRWYCDSNISILFFPLKSGSKSLWIVQQNRVYPYPLGAGSARPNPKIGAPDPENPLFRVFCSQRGIETMVSGHGLGRGQTMG